jgi:hypothetical protein
MLASPLGCAAFNDRQLFGRFSKLFHHSLPTALDDAKKSTIRHFPVDIRGKLAIYADATEFRAEPAYLLQIKPVFHFGSHDIGSDLPDAEAGFRGARACQFL